MRRKFSGNGPVFEAANEAYEALFEGKGMVCRIIDGARDSLVSRGIPRDTANALVIKTRQLFFDPFAAPGVNPTTDPEFKKMLPLFPKLADTMLSRFKFGTQEYDQAGAEEFARYKAESGLDANSVWGLPEFVNSASRDYRLKPDSFGAKEGEFMTFSVVDPEDVIGASEKVIGFCMEHDYDKQMAAKLKSLSQVNTAHKRAAVETLCMLSDEDFEKAEKVNSNTQLYKQAGNSIVVPVLEEIFKKLM